jgi:hyperosmotically inducible periplasmic protein
MKEVTKMQLTQKLIICTAALLLWAVTENSVLAAGEGGAKRGTAVVAEKNVTGQSEDTLDMNITAMVRRGMSKDRGLSVNAHNVKVMTRDGIVTLAGPVTNATEKGRIEHVAAKTPGVKRVKNQLEIQTN